MVAQVACCCCGQPLPRNKTLFGPVRQVIYEYILAHPGSTQSQIAEAIYGKSPDSYSSNVVSVHIHHMRPKLFKLGKGIFSKPGRGGVGYTIMEIRKAD